MYAELKKKKGSSPSEYFFEERIWYLASTLEQFDTTKLSEKVAAKCKGDSFTLRCYMEALYEGVKPFCPWLELKYVERAVYYALWNLIDKASLRVHAPGFQYSLEMTIEDVSSGDEKSSDEEIVEMVDVFNTEQDEEEVRQKGGIE